MHCIEFDYPKIKINFVFFLYELYIISMSLVIPIILSNVYSYISLYSG